MGVGWKEQIPQLIYFAIIFLIAVLGSIFYLVKDPVVRLSEISKLSVLMVTVTGILVGLSPLIYKNRRRWVNIGIISLLTSMITVALADTVPPDQADGVSIAFVVSLLLFLITVFAYATYATRRSEHETEDETKTNGSSTDKAIRKRLLEALGLIIADRIGISAKQSGPMSVGAAKAAMRDDPQFSSIALAYSFLRSQERSDFWNRVLQLILGGVTAILAYVTYIHH